MWVLTAEDVDFDPVVVQMHEEQESTSNESGQRDAIMLEEDEVHLVGGDRFTGYDERNGIEPKRTKISVPSNGIQLFPVNETEEKDTIHRSNLLSKSPDSIEFADDDDASAEFGGISLDQYDDLRGLQMDLDVVTGVGFEMDSSDEEDIDAEINMSNSLLSSDGEIPEEGICVTLDIPRPMALYARSPHLLFGKKGNQRQNVKVSGGAHLVHDFPDPDSMPPRCSTPIPPASPDSGSDQAYDSFDAPAPQPGSLISPAESKESPHSSCSSTAAHPAHTPGSRGTSPIPSSVPASPDKIFCQSSSSTELDLESGMYARFTKVERGLTPQEIDVNEIGELVSRTNGISLKGDAKEFTFAMSLPSKLLSSKFGGVTFAAIGQTKAFGGCVRGALKARGTLPGVVEENVAVEDMEKGASWV